MKTGFTFFGKLQKKFVRKRIETWFSQILRFERAGLWRWMLFSSLSNFSLRSASGGILIDENKMELNEETKKEIELARKAVEEGRYVTHEDLKRELGF